MIVRMLIIVLIRCVGVAYHVATIHVRGCVMRGHVVTAHGLEQEDVPVVKQVHNILL